MADYRVGNILTDFNDYFSDPIPPLFDFLYPDQLSLLVGPSFAGKSWFTLWTAFLLREKGISPLIISTEAARKSEWYHRADHLMSFFPESDVPIGYAPMPYGGLGNPQSVDELLDKVGGQSYGYIFLDSIGSATGRTPSNEEASYLVNSLERVVKTVNASGACALGHNTLQSQERPSEYGSARNRQMGGQTYEGQFGVVIGFNKTPKTKEQRNRANRTLTVRSNVTGKSSIDVEMQFVERNGLGLLVGVERVGESTVDLLERVLATADPDRIGMPYRKIADHPMLKAKRLATKSSDWADVVRATLNRGEAFDNVGSGLYRLSATR